MCPRRAFTALSDPATACNAPCMVDGFSISDALVSLRRCHTKCSWYMPTIYIWSTIYGQLQKQHATEEENSKHNSRNSSKNKKQLQKQHATGERKAVTVVLPACLVPSACMQAGVACGWARRLWPPRCVQILPCAAVQCRGGDGSGCCAALAGGSACMPRQEGCHGQRIPGHGG